MDICKIYRFNMPRGSYSEWLVLSSDYNDDVGAIICRVHHTRRRCCINQIGAFAIEDNDAGDDSFRPSLHYSGQFLRPDDAAALIHVAIVKLRKIARTAPGKNPPRSMYRPDIVLAVAIKAFDAVCAVCEDRRQVWLACRTLGSCRLPMASKRLELLNVAEAERRRRHKMARMIQTRYRSAIADPNTPLCRRRLMREFRELRCDDSTAF